MSRYETRGSDRSVPGIGGSGSEESAADGQSALRLHAGIAAVATTLCIFVTAIFIWLGSTPLAIVFGLIALGSLGALVWALYRRRRGQRVR